jgi:hypothetical protein
VVPNIFQGSFLKFLPSHARSVGFIFSEHRVPRDDHVLFLFGLRTWEWAYERSERYMK